MEQSAKEISHDLQQKLIDYWHDVDFDWGRKAGAHYTQDARFGGVEGVYEGRAEIEAFYRFRETRGARTNVHLVANWTCAVDGEEAKASWICILYAHDGEPPQDCAPPIGIALVKDEYVREGGEWLCRSRMWHPLFRGGVPATVMSPEDRARLAETEGEAK